MAITVTRMPPISEGDVEIVSISYVGLLDSDEVLTGTPVVTEVTTTDLTLSNKTVSSVALIINAKEVAIGKAVQFKIAGQQSGTVYRVRVSVGTATTLRTIVRDVLFPCE